MPSRQRSVQRVLVIANLHKPRSGELADLVRTRLESLGSTVTVSKFSGEPGPLDPDQYDVAFSLGGDGTVLYASRILAARSTPIIGVNMGDFGFLTEIAEEEWFEAFCEYRDGTLEIADRIVQDVRIFRCDREVERFTGLNDTVISTSGIAKIIRLTVYLSSAFLGRYRSDGIIVATPTGSTAHSAAAGGPILDPRMDAMIINPICPFTLSHRPVVVPGDEVVTIEIEPQQRTEVLMTVDGQLVRPLESGDRVIVRRAAARARIVRARKRDFYEVLRTKLNWSGGPGIADPGESPDVPVRRAMIGEGAV